jgi:hypothetical protein
VESNIELVTDSIKHLVYKSAGSMDAYLADFLYDRGKSKLPSGVDIYDVHNFNGMSGLNFWMNGKLLGQVHLSTLTTGNFVIFKSVTDPHSGITEEIYDFYDSEGTYTESASICTYNKVQYSSINMEPLSPFINHFYNILNTEYKSTGLGALQTKQIFYIERYLRRLASEKIGLGVDDGVNDFAYLNIAREVYLTEKDPVLMFEERRKIYQNLRDIRSQIIKTKRRAHRLNALTYDLVIKLRDIRINIALIKRRPLSNLGGFFYRYTIGNLIWFYGMVKDNLGFSIAMAIYAPFTFFFISQPMNPKAMWAVGKIRNAYYDVVETLTPADEANKQINLLDSISTKQAAISKDGIQHGSVDWQTRMNQFKGLEIGFKKNMVDAVRFGTLRAYGKSIFILNHS